MKTAVEKAIAERYALEKATAEAVTEVTVGYRQFEKLPSCLLVGSCN